MEKILVAFLVLSGGSLLFVFYRNTSYLIFFTILLLAFFVSRKKFKRSLFNVAILTFITCIVILFVNYSFAITTQSVIKYFFLILMIAISILTLGYFQNCSSNKSFINHLQFILKIIVFHGLLNFLLYSFLKPYLFDISNNVSHYSCATFYYIFYYLPDINSVNVAGFEFCRNQGIFWEPGVFGIFLNLLFFIEAFVLESKNKTFLLLTAFVILTAYSTTGLLLLLIQIISLVASSNSRYKLISLPILGAFIIPLYMLFNVNLEEKMHGSRAMSFQIRMFDLVQIYAIALEHPLTGIGLDRDQFVEYRFNYFAPQEYLHSFEEFSGLELQKNSTYQGSTNSLIFLLAGTGFPTTILLLYMFAKQQIFKTKKWLFMIIMIIGITSSPLLLRPFFFIFIVSGFMHLFYKIILDKKQLT